MIACQLDGCSVRPKLGRSEAYKVIGEPRLLVVAFALAVYAGTAFDSDLYYYETRASEQASKGMF